VVFLNRFEHPVYLRRKKKYFALELGVPGDMDDGYDFFFKQLPFFQYPYVGKEKSIPFPTTAMAPAAKRPMPEVTFTGVANRFAR